MRNRKAKRNKKRHPATQNTSKLKELHIILHDIALYPELIPSQYKQLFQQQLKHIKSYVFKNHDIQLLKQNIQKANIQNSKSVKKSSLKNTSVRKNRKKHETVKSKLCSKDSKSIKEVLNDNQNDEVLQSRSVKYSWQSIIDSNNKSSGVTCNHISNNISTSKNTVLMNAKVSQHAWRSTISKENRLDTNLGLLDSTTSDLIYGTSVESAKVGSDGTNYLDKKNLIFTDCNSKTQEISSEEISIANTRYDLDLTSDDFINETKYRVQQNCSLSEKSLIIPREKNEISIKKSFENTDKVSKDSHSSDILLNIYNKVNRNENQHDTTTKLNNDGITSATDLKANIVSETIAINNVTEDNLSKTFDENESLATEQTLPKITREAILPKGTVKLVKSVETHSSTSKSISKNISLKQNECNKEDKNIKQMMNKGILEKEKNHMSSTRIELINGSKTSKCALIQKNNEQQDSNTLDNDGSHDKVLNRESSSSLTIKNNVHNDLNINDSSIKAVTSSTIHHQIQDRKRTIEKNSTDVNTRGKRIKLNRNFQQHNVKLYFEALTQHFNDSLNSNATTEDVNCNDVDLRKVLDRKRTEKSSTSETINSNINNTISLEGNDKNSIIGVTNTVENEKTNEKLYQKEASIFYKDVHEVQTNAEINTCQNNDLSDDLSDALKDVCHSQTKIDTCKDTNIQKEVTHDVNDDNNCNNEDDDDCISLFANETFDISYCEDMFSDKPNKLSKSLQFDTPYIMSTNSFNKYIKQNTNEFNKEYERCMRTNIEKSQIVQNRTEYNIDKKKIENSSPKYCNENMQSTVKETQLEITQTITSPNRTVFDKQLESETSCADNLPTNSTNLTLSTGRNMETSMHYNVSRIFHGFCYSILMHSNCRPRFTCFFNHNFQDFIQTFRFKSSNEIMIIINFAIYRKFYFFCQELYKTSLKILNIDEILTVFKMFYNIYKLSKNITYDVIKELLSRQMSLKNIVDHIVEYIKSSGITDIIKNYEIFKCIKYFMKPSEYWCIAKSMVLILTPDIRIIEDILDDCTHHRKLSDVQDINDTLLPKLHFGISSRLDKCLMTRFENLLTEKATKDTFALESVQDFGENTVGTDTIASPDSRQMESPRSYNNVVINNNQINKIEKCSQEVNTIDSRPYILHPIDNLPPPRSVYRDHQHLWKFYMDLERFKKGLEHQDYDYVIDILEEYIGKQDDSLFVRSCCNMLRTEIKRTDHHLVNIIQRTVQTGTFAALREILFDIGLDILIALMDEEAWRLAFQFIKFLKTCDLPQSAEFTMLSAEIYLANNKILEALDLLKKKNIICTSRVQWHVISTVHDEYVRNKLMHILLDSLCNSSIEHAFFLFTFLLRDQSSQFNPIDLSRYVDKLILQLLSRDETTLVMEMGDLILKYNFPLSTKTCRALITTLIHIDKKLATQLYYYAENVGFYPAVELWPITHIIINNDLTEEEVYLVVLRLLEKLKLNFGHAIEFIKSQQFAVYVILEVKSTNQFYCAEQQISYNSQAIASIKTLIRNVLKTRFDPPISLTARTKEKICKLQNKSLINYLKSEHCS